MNKTLNETSLANTSSLFINTTDYESNSKFQNNFLEYNAQTWLYKEYMRNLIDSINYCFVPLAACIGIFFNFICIVAFSSSRLKSTIYRYLFYNSLFDTITLVIAFVRTFTVYVQVEQVIPYNQFFEPYLLVYFLFYFHYYLQLCLTHVAILVLRFLNTQKLDDLNSLCRTYVAFFFMSLVLRIFLFFCWKIWKFSEH